MLPCHKVRLSLCAQLAKLVARNQELVQEMERVRSELEKTKFELEEKDRKLSTERDSDVCKRSFEVLVF